MFRQDPIPALDLGALRSSVPGHPVLTVPQIWTPVTRIEPSRPSRLHTSCCFERPPPGPTLQSLHPTLGAISAAHPGHAQGNPPFGLPHSCLCAGRAEHRSRGRQRAHRPCAAGAADA
eukprot:135497-Chlamydomonas_euryale.AAC.2